MMSLQLLLVMIFILSDTISPIVKNLEIEDIEEDNNLMKAVESNGEEDEVQ